MAPLLALVLLGGTSGGLVWKFPTGVNPEVFALADSGGQVYVEPPGDQFVCLSAFDSTPPTPVWRCSHGYSEDRIRCASATNVVLRSSYRLLSDEGPEQSFLQLFTSSSQAPVWSHAFPPQFLSFPAFDVSADGRTIVSVLHEMGSPPRATIRVHDPETGVPLRTFEVPPEFGAQLHLSSDGSALALSGGTNLSPVVRVLDLRSEATLFETDGRLPGRQAISRDGGVCAIILHEGVGPSTLRVFARGPGGYGLVLERKTRLYTPLVACAVSDDGSTVAANWYNGWYPQRAIVRAFDVASGMETMEDVIVGDALDNLAYGLAICADGSRFVVGCWGDAAGSVAELRLYSRDRDAPLVEYPAGGSVQDVDISPDGKRLAASRGAVHFDHVTQCFVELYEVGGQDLAVRGRPSIGSTITLEAHAAPGSTAYLLFARALAPVPIDVPGVGVLYLDPATLARRPLGSVPPSGDVAVRVSIPNDAAAVGEKVYYQVLATDPRAIGRDFAQVTILP